MSKIMYVYILANSRPTLYVGVTNNLIRRIYEHKKEFIEGFTKKYHLHKLVYYEMIEGQFQAIIREKQIKDMNRADKIEMIRKFNPQFEDLYSRIVEDSGQARMTISANVILGSGATPESKQRKDSGQVFDREAQTESARMTSGGTHARY